MSLSEERILSGLNDEQKRAVMTTEGPLLIVAGPGTGKTLTIVRRIAYLIYKGVDPRKILAVTFTNRAAREMRERTGALIGEDSGKVFINTFHMLGLTMMKQEYSNKLLIIDREEQVNLIRDLLKDSGRGKKARRADNISERISRIKNGMEDVDSEIKCIYEKYQETLANRGGLDFDDLILKPVEMLKSGGFLERYRNAFRYIMVDEYQDINRTQYMLLLHISDRNANLCVIGDSDQAIYAFRGADVGNFLNFENDFSNAEIITLRENYRSTGVILNASNIVIRNNQRRIGKSLKQTREKGVSINVVSVPDERSEGHIIVSEIEERMGGTSHYHMMKKANSCTPPSSKEERGDSYGIYSYSFSDFAVIYRTNAQAKAIEDSFISAGIPCQIIGRNNRRQGEEIMKALAVLRVLNNQDDHQHSMTVDLSPGEIDKEFLERFRDFRNSMPLGELLGMLWKECNMKKYCSEENFMLLGNLASAYRHMDTKEAISSFISEISLLTPADAYDPRADAVALMTFHTAKGLEFKMVFIIGFEDGIVPYTINKDSVDIEEERRLFYVGMTRAMDELFLIHTRNRLLFGKRRDQVPSPFIRELPEELMAKRYVPDRIKKTKKDNQIGLF